MTSRPMALIGPSVRRRIIAAAVASRTSNRSKASNTGAAGHHHAVPAIMDENQTSNPISRRFTCFHPRRRDPHIAVFIPDKNGTAGGRSHFVTVDALHSGDYLITWMDEGERLHREKFIWPLTRSRFWQSPFGAGSIATFRESTRSDWQKNADDQKRPGHDSQDLARYFSQCQHVVDDTNQQKGEHSPGDRTLSALNRDAAQVHGRDGA
jgi:hypothetical protein